MNNAPGGGHKGAQAAHYEQRPDDQQVVCARCFQECASEWGHHLHCRLSGGKCAGADSIPFAVWKASESQRRSDQAAHSLADGGWLNTQAAALSDAYTTMYYHQMASRKAVESCKALVRDHVTACKEEVLRRLGRGKSPAEVQGLSDTLKDIFEVHRHVETESELTHRVQPVTPVERELLDEPNERGVPQGLRRGDHVYDVPICESLKAILRDRPCLLRRCREAAASWVNPRAGESLTVFSDIPDGAVFQAHPELGVGADCSDGAVRLAFILYYDEVEVVNSLGSFTGTHKIGLFYWALINLPPDQRMDLCNIHLATVVLDTDMHYYGAEQVVSGPPGEPDYPHGSSIGASLRALHGGIELSEPVNGQYVPVLTRGWLVIVSADHPAAAVLTGTMIGVGANKFCRECEADRRNCGHDHPCSFLNPTAATPPPRTLQKRLAEMDTCGNDEKKMASAGWTSWAHAFARCGPYFDFLKQVPYDLMHVEAEGLLKYELACFIFYCVRQQTFFDLADLNSVLDTYEFPGGGKQIPYFMEGLLKGKDAADREAKKAK